MSAHAVSGPRPVTRTGGRTVLRLLAPLIAFAVVLLAVVGVRAVVARQQEAQQAATAAAFRSFPANPTIEERWGIRFTAVNVLADGGIVELRYIVIDPAKGARIHSGKLADLPQIRADDTGKTIRSNSLMFHVHFDHTPTNAEGRSYSIIYGNADGAAHIGGTVTLVLADGLRLERIPVS